MATTNELGEEVLQQLPEEFVVDIAALDDDAQTQVIEAVQAAADEGALGDLDVDRTIADAQEVSERKEEVEEIHKEQAEAVADGDFEHAKELAQDAQWEMKEIDDHGGESEVQMLEAERDEANLDQADWEQDTAADQTEWAGNLAASGDVDGAATQLDLAAGHTEVSADYAGVADQGGTTADHSYDSTVDTTTTE
jgi:hypothetical protein